MDDVATLELAEAQLALAKAIKSVEKVQGEPGKTGKQGLAGPSGKSIRGPIGPAGTNGTNGKDGARGDTGPTGPTGPAGKDGVGPDEQVRVSKKDPVAGFLADKLKAGLGVRLRQEKSPDGDSVVIDSVGQSGGMGGGGLAGVKVYDDGAGNFFGDALSFDGGSPVTVSGGIIHVPVGSTGSGSDDQTAAEVPFTPAGTIAATNVQDAIEEVAAEAGGVTSPLTGATVDGATGGQLTFDDAFGGLPGSSEAGDASLKGGTDVDGATGGSVQASGGGFEQGGRLRLKGGNGAALGGDVEINAGAVSDAGHSGASVNIAAGTNSDGGTPATIRVAGPAAGSTGGDVVLSGGDDNISGNVGAALRVQGGIDATGGGSVAISGGVGGAGLPGGDVSLAGGTGDGTNDVGALVLVEMGSGTGAAGRVWIKSDGSFGTVGQVLTADASGNTARWQDVPGVTPATDPSDIADPTVATAETVALKLNALMGAMRTAGMLA